jgi:hydroxymethylbilane synthase
MTASSSGSRASDAVVIGTRGSALSRTQTEEVAAAMRRRSPQRQIVVRFLRTQGDRDTTTPLAGLGLGIFTREIENALLAGEIHLAVHSMKDLATELPPGLTIAAVPPRGDPRDVLVSRDGRPLAGLSPGARIGTSSPRRSALVKALRPDVEVLSIRGNVETRLKKALEGPFDAVVLAAIGLARLGLEGHIAEYFDPLIFIPAVGQGALAVEAREDDPETAALVRGLDHGPSRAAAMAERAFLRALGGGCRVPMAAYAQAEGDSLRLVGLVTSKDGQQMFRAQVVGSLATPEEAGRRLAHAVLAQGAGKLVPAGGGA